jgi:hypothetical protein
MNELHSFRIVFSNNLPRSHRRAKQIIPQNELFSIRTYSYRNHETKSDGFLGTNWRSFASLADKMDLFLIRLSLSRFLASGEPTVIATMRANEPFTDFCAFISKHSWTNHLLT